MLARILGLAALLGAATPAWAETWVTVAEVPERGWRIAVDVDSVRLGSDGIVYFSTDGGGRLHKAANCAKRIQHTVRLHYGEQVTEFPEWRTHGGRITEHSLESAAFDFACARAKAR